MVSTWIAQLPPPGSQKGSLCPLLWHFSLAASQVLPVKEGCSEHLTQAEGKPFICTPESKPVCGSNGLLYDNKCLLCAAARETRVNIGIRGKQERKPKVDCNRYPRAKERGPFFCPKVYKPVCGTNDMTYGNKCLLCSAIWETGINIGMKHKGKCGEKVGRLGSGADRVSRPPSSQASQPATELAWKV
ncbi:ovomucoid-like [Terrapene carolina triunguis]|uniref:ovomucoid-like n=1 Tax=Terrapene triunguis TaxID=2587831 RepID=UPI001156352D|nr:ovomucoid-like [Terrapene carolina triunguis]